MSTISNRKVALVTGANKGIGKAIVRGLAEAGFVVYLARATRRAAARLRLSWRKWAMFALCNWTFRRSFCSGCRAANRSEVGKLDALVNNAGHRLCPRVTFPGSVR